jgi:adenylate cyclase
VKGKKEPIDIYEIIESCPKEIKRLKIATEQFIKQGLEYRREKLFDEAIKSFEKGLDIYPEDKAVQIHIERCKELQKMNLPDYWDGAIDMDQK